MKKKLSIITLVILLLTSVNSYVFALTNDSDLSKNAGNRGVGSTIAETFPDPALALYMVDQLGATDVNTVITQEMVDSYTSVFISGDNIYDLTGIEIFVDASTLGIDSLPAATLDTAVCNLTKIQGLHFSNTQFTELPECVGNFTKLENFTVINNTKLTTLPESIGTWKELRSMTIISNESFTTLPNAIGELTMLQVIDISNAPIETLPESFGNLSNLTNMMIRMTPLKELPESFGNLSSLVTASLMNNEIEKLPDSIGNLPTLQSMALSYNEISEIPESFANMPSLMMFGVDNNQLTSLPNSVAEFTGYLQLFNNLLPSDYAVKLNELVGEERYTNDPQSQLTLKTELAPYEITSMDQLNNFDFPSALKLVDAFGSELTFTTNPPSPFKLATTHNYIFENYVDESGAAVNIEDYIKNGVVQSDATLFVQIRATGKGLYPNTSEHALTVDKIQLNLKAIPYDVTFDLNGATGVAPATESLIEGSKVTAVEDPIRDGFIFKGWNTAADGTGTNWDFTTTTVPAENVTLFAIWEKELVNYDLIFDLNGATGTAPAVQSIAQGDVATNVATPTRDGFVFKGWNTMADGTGLNWILGETTMPAQDVTLFAIWEKENTSIVDIVTSSTLPTTGSALNLFGIATLLGFAVLNKLKHK